MESSYRLVVFDDEPFNLLKTITYTSTIYTRIGYKYISSATTPDWYAGSGAKEPKMDLANKAYVETYYVKGDPDSNASLTLAYRTIVKSGDKATNSNQTFKIPAKAFKTDTYSKVDIYTAGYMSGGTERVVISVFVDGVFMDKKDYVKPWNEFYGIEYDDIYFNIENTGLTRMQQAEKTSETAYVTAWTDTVANRTRGVDFSVSQTAGFQVVEHNAAASTSLSGNLPSGFPAESIATPATISVTGVKPEYAASSSSRPMRMQNLPGMHRQPAGNTSLPLRRKRSATCLRAKRPTSRC